MKPPTERSLLITLRMTVTKETSEPLVRASLYYLDTSAQTPELTQAGSIAPVLELVHSWLELFAGDNAEPR